jgi:hypothetical protein
MSRVTHEELVKSHNTLLGGYLEVSKKLQEMESVPRSPEITPGSADFQ